jgi:hypothetical protein
MDERKRRVRRHKQDELAEADRERRSSRRQSNERKGAAAGAVMGTVAVGPLGAPIGAAAGAAVGALTPDPDSPPAHTHDLDAPCYDGCPAWPSTKNV